MIEHGRGGKGVVLKVESNDAKVVKLRVTHFLLCVLHLMKDYINEVTFPSPRQSHHLLILAGSISRQVAGAGGRHDLLDGGRGPKLEVVLRGRHLPRSVQHL